MGFLTTVCADKASPGASTLALLLAAAAPGGPLLVEADPAGGDLAQRLFPAGGHVHPAGANLLALASASRRSTEPQLVAAHAATTPVGVPLVEGLASADQQVGLAPLWPSLTAAVLASDRDVIIDLGRISAVHPGLGLVTAAHRIVLVVRPELEQLVRLRDRVHQLLGVIGGDTSRVLVAVVAPDKNAHRDQLAAARVLSEEGLGTVRVDWFPFNPKELAAFYAGRLGGRSYLWRAATGLAAHLTLAGSGEPPRPTHDTPANRDTAESADVVATVGEVSWITS